MSAVFTKIQALVAAMDVRVSEYGYEAMSEDSLTAREISTGISKEIERPAVIVTAYRPDPERWDESMTRRQSS